MLHPDLRCMTGAVRAKNEIVELSLAVQESHER